ncbi:hypothetical protein GQ42DRAFT_5756 [Ramicandelaber brevisporus]|nr:hypothetical protein GQ42DRAFT_5756 [Ramicandelaber brevisporus]
MFEERAQAQSGKCNGSPDGMRQCGQQIAKCPNGSVSANAAVKCSHSDSNNTTTSSNNSSNNNTTTSSNSRDEASACFTFDASHSMQVAVADVDHSEHVRSQALKASVWFAPFLLCLVFPLCHSALCFPHSQLAMPAPTTLK